MKNGKPIVQELKTQALYLEKLIEEDKVVNLGNDSILSEDDYKNITEFSSVGIFIGDSYGKIVSWNNSMENLTGIKKSDAEGIKVSDVFFLLTPKEYKNPELLVALENRLLRSINERPYLQRQVYDQRMTSLDGTNINVKVSSFVTASQNGNLLVTVFRDISAQKQVEKTLALQNEALLKLTRFSLELSRLSFNDDLEVFITRQIKEITGAIGVIFSDYNVETRTLTPKHIEMEPGLMEILVNLFDKHVHKIHSVLSDYMFLELSSSMIAFGNSLAEVSIGVIPSSVASSAQAMLMADRFIRVAYLVDGTLYGTTLLALNKQQPDPPKEILENFVFLAASFLKRKHAEEILRKDEEMLRTVTYNSSDIILNLNDKGTILYTNHGFSGHKEEVVIGRNFREWTAPEYHDLMSQCLIDVFSNAQPQTYQTRALGSNHEIRWYSSRLTPVLVGEEVKSAVLVMSDITERKRDEDALHESEENYRVIAQSSLDIIFIIDRFGKNLFFNNRIEKNLGYKVEEVIGRSFSGFLPEEHILDFHTQLENIFLYKEICHFTTLIYHKEGNLVDVEVNIKLVKLKDEYVGLGSMRDITAKKRAEENVMTTNKRNNEIMVAIPDMMFVFNSDYKIVDFHFESHDQLFGEPELFIGKPVDDVLPHDVAVVTRQKVDNVLLTRFSDYSNYELEIGGRNRFFESRYTPCGKNEVLSIVRDITEQKKSEGELNIARESYFEIFNSVPEAICILDEQGTFLDANKSAGKLYLIENMHLIGKSLSHFAAHDRNNFEEIKNMIHSVSENGATANFEFWAERNNGEIILEEIILNKGKYFGRNVLIATCRDITKKKEAEEQLKIKNEELINLNTEKDKFFSIMAHDLRSPLVSFLGLTQIMAEDLGSLTINEIQDLASSMKKSADNLFGLLENLLEWSRLQRGLIRFVPKKVLLIPKIEDTLQGVLELTKKKEIEIEVNVPENLEVVADENMLASTFRNLASNAVKFTSKGGKINISARRSDDDSVEFSFSDSGIGMDEDILKNLFLIDSHSSRPGTEGEPSSGIGLIICKDFIERHGGKIWAESEEGKGSTFHFTIPGKKMNGKNVDTVEINKTEQNININ